MIEPTGDDRFTAVPLFPLPNVVLFPRAVLPLHIFEERYKAMTRDALAGDELIAMALLQPGWELDYYGAPMIEPVVCMGKILTHERLPDGKYNLLLEGAARAYVEREIGGDLPYRVTDLRKMKESAVLEIDLEKQRQSLTAIFEDRLGSSMLLVKQFRQMLASPLPTADVADLISFNLLEDVLLKQSLLADKDVARRINRLIAALEAMPPSMPRGDTPSLN